MGGACSTRRRMRSEYKILVRTPDGRRPLRSAGLDWRITGK